MHQSITIICYSHVFNNFSVFCWPSSVRRMGVIGLTTKTQCFATKFYKYPMRSQALARWVSHIALIEITDHHVPVVTSKFDHPISTFSFDFIWRWTTTNIFSSSIGCVPLKLTQNQCMRTRESVFIRSNRRCRPSAWPTCAIQMTRMTISGMGIPHLDQW